MSSNYFIVREIIPKDFPDSCEHQILIRWEPSTEKSQWYRPQLWNSLPGFKNLRDWHNSDHCKWWNEPLGFSSKVEAQEVVNILKAYDDPNILKEQGTLEINYYVANYKLEYDFSNLV